MRAKTARWQGRPLLALLGGLGLVVAIRSGGEAGVSHSDATPRPVRGDTPGKLRPYERKNWRLAPQPELQRTVVWLSHILIAHRETDPRQEIYLRGFRWRPDDIAPPRSRARAMSDAMKLRQQVATKPEAFAEYARERSDDRVTAKLGGALGGRTVVSLPPEFVDAAASLRPGEISRVIERPLGFHILRREAPPKAEQIAGRRIVVRYETTVSSGVREASRRTRDEAAALASQTYTAAVSGKVSFDELARLRSEAPDRIRGGDLGVWHTHEPNDDPQAFHVLFNLAVEAVAAPVETRFGFEILKRVEVVARPQLAMRAIRFQFDPNAPAERPGSYESVRDAAVSLARSIDGSAVEFASALAGRCCDEPQAWTLGRGPYSIERPLARLEMNDVSTEALEWDSFFLIPQRIHPDQAPQQPQPIVEIPLPDTVDLRHLIRTQNGIGIGQYANAFTELATSKLRHELDLDSSEMEQLRQTLNKLGTDCEVTDEPATREAAWDHALDALSESLGTRKRDEVVDALARWVTDIFLGAAPDPIAPTRQGTPR